MISTETLVNEGKMIAGRQVLMVLYEYYKPDVENCTVYDIEDVIAVSLHNNDMEGFLQKWDKVLLGLAEALPCRTEKAMFVSKVKNCSAFRQEYLHYKRMSPNDPCKTYEYLRDMMKATIEEKR